MQSDQNKVWKLPSPEYVLEQFMERMKKQAEWIEEPREWMLHAIRAAG